MSKILLGAPGMRGGRAPGWPHGPDGQVLAAWGQADPQASTVGALPGHTRRHIRHLAN